MAQLLTNPTCGWLFPLVESLSGRKVERDDLFACVRDEQVAVFPGINDRRERSLGRDEYFESAPPFL
jgi:hypothetical protein